MTCAKMMAATATATLTAGMRRPRAAGRIDAGMMRCFLQTLAYGWPRPLVARRVRPMFSRLAASALAAKRQGGKNWDAGAVAARTMPPLHASDHQMHGDPPFILLVTLNS